MNTSIIRQTLLSTLATPQEDFSEGVKKFLGSLGYHSDRTLTEQSGSVDDFISLTADTERLGTASEQALRKNTKSVKIVFQITNDEIGGGHGMDFENGNTPSFVFTAVELERGSYPRGKYAELTREINKRLSQATVVLFKTANNLLTLAFVNRRQHQRNQNRDVLGNVSLIREINPADPHRAHLEILSELTLEKQLQWIDDHNKQRNFDGLLAAWLNTLNTEELNRQFYRDLYNWFDRAVQKTTFPTNQAKTLKPEEHVIRLITRLLFVWFIKEKGLIAPDLFNEDKIRGLLQNYDRDSGDSYYRAVLQNLFFATLNTEIDKRGFSNKKNSTHRDFSCYRYIDEMSDSDRLLKLFNQTPFINGGLFDCLDSEEAISQGGYRIDCFTDNSKQRGEYSVPNCLFFGNDGLITLFNHYKFTVEENTPAEQEVALDPELLGSVFENLLAAYNPETRDTARKQTGSYYTPRPVVDYMVDEALVETLAEKSPPTDGDGEFWRDRLRYLLAYDAAFSDAGELFNEDETNHLVCTIAEIKVLDPAVGSGAFPMGILHKLTLALRRLDPQNHRWKNLQKEHAQARASAAFDTQNKKERDKELEEISETFERYRDSDFGRKLYLIQNSIFGVDIQPIACQIAKLRFFISLTIEQTPTGETLDNYGIKPLPNLETRFVAANTLRSLGKSLPEFDKTTQPGLEKTDATIARLEQELNTNRERQFHATTRQQKLKYRKENKGLRKALAIELMKIGMPHDAANKISQWDPDDQNVEAADWFDAEYMFGVIDGVDIIIANPPYINVENLSDRMRSYLLKNYRACEKRTDIYIAFLEKSLSILSSNGLMCFIIPATFTKASYGKKMRYTLIKNHAIQGLVDASSYRIFENTVVHNIILTVTKDKNKSFTKVRLYHSNNDFENCSGTEFLVDQNLFTSLKDYRFDTNQSIADYIKIKEKIWRNAIRFDQVCLIAYGARLNHRSKTIGKSHYISPSPIIGGKKFCEGRNIERYSFSQKGWLNYMPEEHYNPMFPELFENEKLMFINVVKDRLRFAYDNEGFYNSHTVINCVRLDSISGVSHISAVRAMEKSNITIAKQFDYKFLLAILNSQFTNWYFLNFLGDNLHFYPTHAKELPIPKISADEQRPFIRLVDDILSAKAYNSEADTSELEDRIDQLIYQFYGLTEEEIAVIK